MTSIMLRTLATFAVAFALASTPSVVPAKHLDTSNIKASVDGDQSSHDQTVISVSGSDSNPVPWRLREWIAFSANLLLVFVGGFGVLAAYKTLGKIERQTKAGEDAAIAAKYGAEAALKNANAVINSERAWILVKRSLPPKELVPNSLLSQEEVQRQTHIRLENDMEYQAASPVDRWELEMLKRETVRAEASAMRGLWVLMFGFRFKVFGNTPAKLFETALIFRVVNGRKRGLNTEPDLPDEPDYGTPSRSDEIPDMGTVLAPGFRFSYGVPLVGGKLSPQEIVDICERRKFLCAWGMVRYRDAFEGTPIRETRFCYVYDVKVGRVYLEPETKERVSPDAFRVGGPEAYNGAS